MDPVFSSEYNKLLNSMDNIRRRINATSEIGDPERKGCVSSDHQALDRCHQRLRAIYLERLREAVRDQELAAAPRDLAGPTPSPDVCDKVELELASALRGSSLDENDRRRDDKVDPERPSSLRGASLDNDRRRVARGLSLERAVSWKGNIEAVCMIPSRHDTGSAFTKQGFVRKLQKLRSRLLLTTTTMRNSKASSESAAAASRSGAEPAMGDINECNSA